MKKLISIVLVLLVALSLGAEPSSLLDTERVDHNGFVLYYSEAHENPALVWWIVTREQREEGDDSGRDAFAEDPVLKRTTRSALPSDYTNLTDKFGQRVYDRGHIFSSESADYDDEVQKRAFYMSNMSPQHQGLNRGAWKTLEERERALAIEVGKLLVIAGPVLGESDLGVYQRAKTAITIPSEFYKIFVWRVGNQLIMRAWIFPNTRVTGDPDSYEVRVEEAIRRARVTLTDLESLL
jgi:DNA/RNA endonuclease G (NUC1)